MALKLRRRVRQNLAASYTVIYNPSALIAPWSVQDGMGRIVDRYRTESAAAHAARMLTVGVAVAEQHRPLGTRVMPAPSQPMPANLPPTGQAADARALLARIGRAI